MVEAYDDPKVSGVTCYVSRAKTGGLSGAFGLAEDKAEASIACRQVGPVARDRSRCPSARRSTASGCRSCSSGCAWCAWSTPKRNTLVYLTYSDLLIDGSPKNSVTAVPIDRAHADPAEVRVAAPHERAPRHERSSAPGNAAAAAPGHAMGAMGELYGALWRYAEGKRGQLLGATALLTGSQLLRLTMPWLAAQAINALQTGDIASSGRWIAALAGIYLLSWVIHGPGRILERNVGLRVRETLADALYARIAAAPLAWHDGHHSGELQHRVHQASRALSDFAQNQFIYLTNIVNFIGPLVALTLLSRTSGAVAIAGYVVIAVVIVRFDRALMRLARAENDADRRYVAALLDFLANASTVIGLRLSAASRLLLAPAHGRRSRRRSSAPWCSTRASGSRST